MTIHLIILYTAIVALAIRPLVNRLEIEWLRGVRVYGFNIVLWRSPLNNPDLSFNKGKVIFSFRWRKKSK